MKTTYKFDRERGKVVRKPEAPSNVIEMLALDGSLVDMSRALDEARTRILATFGGTMLSTEIRDRPPGAVNYVSRL